MANIRLLINDAAMGDHSERPPIADCTPEPKRVSLMAGVREL